MLQQLALETEAQAWALASMIFFVSVFALLVVRVLRTPSTEHQAHARLPLADGSENHGEASSKPREVPHG